MNPIVSTVEYRPQQQQHVPLLIDEEIATATAAEVIGSSSRNASTNEQQSTAFAVPKPPTPLPPKIAPKAAGSSYKTKRVFKVIIIGNAGVGKTCLSYRFCNGKFPDSTEATIGVDFRERCLAINDELIRVQLWDTAGQERYRQSIIAHYYRNVNAVVFVYDITNPESFESLPSWIAECKKHALSSDQDTPHILIGNKCDLPAKTPQNEQQRVRTDQAQIFADENDMALFETSALSDSEADHVESIFMTLVHKLRQSKAMHVQSSEERVQREHQKILLKANEAAKLKEGGEEDDWTGMCC